MAIVAKTYAYVIGVDAHARTHTFAAVESRTGAVLATSTFPATLAGVNRALAWVGRSTGGSSDTLVVVEGIGSYGARVARAAADAGYVVAEPAAVAPALRRGDARPDAPGHPSTRPAKSGERVRQSSRHQEIVSAPLGWGVP